MAGGQRINDTLRIAGHGEYAGNATGQTLTSTSAKWAKFKAMNSNAGTVYIGTASGITVAQGSDNSTTGWPLGPNEETDWLPVPGGDLDGFYFITDNAGDDFAVLWLS